MPVLTQEQTAALFRPDPSAVEAAWACTPIEPHTVTASAVGDAEFVALQSAYRQTGGMAHGDELAARLHVDGAGGYARLARWIVGGQVFSFTWHEHFWLPMFQFDAADLSPHRCLRPVLSELADVMDGKALAIWFAQPNGVLQGSSPAARCAGHWPDVFHAARLQHFVMKG